MNRRDIIKSSLATTAALTLGASSKLMAAPVKKKKHNFTYCLNTSTIMKQKVGLMTEIELAAKAGFDGIEIWMRTLEAFVKEGGKLSDVKKKASDLGITIEDSIGFAAWVVDNDETRNKAIEQTKREMDMLAKIGCKRIAAPPFGATNEPGLDLRKAAERFAVVCDLGKEMGVLPQLELWGFSQNLHLFGETLFVAAESGHPDAVILPDVYHLRRGGSPFEALEMINGSKIQMFHMNDYPGDIEKSKLTDAMRVMPGDGDAPFDDILSTLNAKGVPISLSLEIFNEDVWKMDAFEACKMGLSKMKAVVNSAVA
ncbi:sugar phosphate isomerase/epimerase family protein [Arcticibacterium luteifluviistationis]|uniref:Xylose isomerase n=1 Tax=Arcticibacterium luteifluviistationis TaxID=1784714 RepID=A0A2Z4GA25_9BACT|nr:sugar phosphate isomerase/epimerase family protein [Arcticibacterium luteifluviistationis]AWV98057.1 xylose isomerase [Arcticibacterium luteifluviistationis]